MIKSGVGRGWATIELSQIPRSQSPKKITTATAAARHPQIVHAPVIVAESSAKHHGVRADVVMAWANGIGIGAKC